MSKTTEEKTSQWSERRLRLILATFAVLTGGWLDFISVNSYLEARIFAELAIKGQADGELFAKIRRECVPKGIDQLSQECVFLGGYLLDWYFCGIYLVYCKNKRRTRRTAVAVI